MMEVPPMDPPGAPEQVCHQGRRRCLAATAEFVFLQFFFLSDKRISLALNVWCNRELTQMRRNGGRVQSLVVQQNMPKLTTRKCSSCYILGFKKFYQGIKMRPVVPFQSEVITLLQQQLAKGPSFFF